MAKTKKRSKKSSKSLDSVSAKKPGRGRPGVRREKIAGRAYHYGIVFDQCWVRIREEVLAAKSVNDIATAFKRGAEPYVSYFIPHQCEAILEIARDPKFPTRPAAQARFLADSLAALGQVSARRSRDICAEERNRVRHKIVRQDYFIACTCGYEGPALSGACRGCGTREIESTLLLSQRFYLDQ